MLVIDFQDHLEAQYFKRYEMVCELFFFSPLGHDNLSKKKQTNAMQVVGFSVLRENAYVPAKRLHSHCALIISILKSVRKER